MPVHTIDLSSTCDRDSYAVQPNISLERIGEQLVVMEQKVPFGTQVMNQPTGALGSPHAQLKRYA